MPRLNRWIQSIFAYFLRTIFTAAATDNSHFGRRTDNHRIFLFQEAINCAIKHFYRVAIHKRRCSRDVAVSQNARSGLIANPNRGYRARTLTSLVFRVRVELLS